MRGLLAAFLFASSALGQAYPPNYPYLLRLDHSNFEGHSCALLQNTGAFHLEVDSGGDVKVFEGTVPGNRLGEIEAALYRGALANLSQAEIQEPLIRTKHDELQVTVFGDGAWRDLYFQSSDSQAPFKQSLQPLIGSLDHMRKFANRELSEEAGKNNCLPPKVIALRTRDVQPPSQPISLKTTRRILSADRTPQARPSPPATPLPISTLLRMYFFENKTSSAHESCALVAGDGRYRFEDRTQKAGKPVEMRITQGEITGEQLQQLSSILSDPAIEKMKHREPAGARIVPMLGDMLQLSIWRRNGSQELVLSSAYKRPGMPSFYRGDGDIHEADRLRKFLAEKIQNADAEHLKENARNSCTGIR
jgi:hypothetical protein